MWETFHNRFLFVIYYRYFKLMLPNFNGLSGTPAPTVCNFHFCCLKIVCWYFFPVVIKYKSQAKHDKVNALPTFPFRGECIFLIFWNNQYLIEFCKNTKFPQGIDYSLMFNIYFEFCLATTGVLCFSVRRLRLSHFFNFRWKYG